MLHSTISLFKNKNFLTTREDTLSQEILGKWVCEVDDKWRLNIPAPVRKTIGQVILLKLNAEDCIELKKISFRAKAFRAKDINSAAIARRVKGGRITIPIWLRNSTSFYCGKKVMLTLQNDHFEIWPWP